MPVHVRPAVLDDLEAINDIYNWYVPRSTCTYQEEPETTAARRAWFAKHDARHPVTAAEVDGVLVGWAALSAYRERSAYRFTCENSVYVRHDAQGRGIGSALLADLIARASSLGFHSIIAGIDAEQAGSIALHAKHAFVDCGRQRQVGYKLGRWLDVVFMQRLI